MRRKVSDTESFGACSRASNNLAPKMRICSGRRATAFGVLSFLAAAPRCARGQSPQDCFRSTGYTYVVAQEVYADAGNSDLQAKRKQRCEDAGMKYGDVLYQTGSSVAGQVLIADWETAWAAAKCGGASLPAALLTCSGTYTPATASSLEAYLSSDATVFASSQDSSTLGPISSAMA